jgi:hypothetical protein
MAHPSCSCVEHNDEERANAEVRVMQTVKRDEAEENRTLPNPDDSNYESRC